MEEREYILSKYVDRKSMITNSKRSSRVVLTNEGRVLRELRITRGFSMKKAGALIGLSDSYISHIENGRLDPPKGKRLEQILSAYGGITVKSYYDRVRRFKRKTTPLEELNVLLKKLTDEKIRMLYHFARSIV